MIRSRYGFTLLEMLVCVCITLILVLALYATAGRVTRRDRLMAETNAFVALVNATRTRSLTDGGPWNRIVLYRDTAEGDRWWVDQCRPKTPPAPQDIDARVANVDVFEPMCIPKHILHSDIVIESIFVNNTDTAATYTLTAPIAGIALRFALEGTSDEALVTLVTRSTPVLRSQVYIAPATSKPTIEMVPEWIK